MAERQLWRYLLTGRHIHTRAVSLALLVTLLAVVPTSAKGSFGKLIVYGEGEAVEITHQDLLAFDSFNEFSAPYRGIPSVTTPGLLIIRGAVDSRTGQFVAFDSLRLFPETSSSDAFVYYEGLVNGWSEYDHRWYAARPEAGEALLAALGSSAADARGTSPSTVLIATTVIAGAVGFLSGRWAHRRRNGTTGSG
jgi:hypothetical protein